MNAIQASKPGESIKVSTSSDVDFFNITVEDQGSGIKQENKDKIFDPFFTTKNVGEGSGLGLSISIGIMQYHNGSLTLSNNQHGGVNATMKLPLQAVHP